MGLARQYCESEARNEERPLEQKRARKEYKHIVRRGKRHVGEGEERRRGLTRVVRHSRSTTDWHSRFHRVQVADRNSFPMHPSVREGKPRFARARRYYRRSLSLSLSFSFPSLLPLSHMNRRLSSRVRANIAFTRSIRNWHA